MKKFLIFLITILILLMIMQLIYFNLKKNKNEDLIGINQTNENTVENQTNIYDKEIIGEETIETTGLKEIMEQYSGKVSIDFVEEELNTFINTDMTKIYDMTTGKSNNKILQKYDLETDAINEMNIYSGEDFLEIVRQIFLVGNVKKVKCISRSVEENSYNFNDNGYTSFNIVLKFDSSNTIKLKLNLANEETSNPSFKFEKAN